MMLKNHAVGWSLLFFAPILSYADSAYLINQVDYTNYWYVATVDTNTADLGYLGEIGTSAGPMMGEVHSLEIENQDYLLAFCNAYGDEDTQLLLRIDRQTGMRTIVSSDLSTSPVGTGVDFSEVYRGTYDMDMSGTSKVIINSCSIYNEEPDAIYEVDLTTGNRSVIVSYTAEETNVMTDFLEKSDGDLVVYHPTVGLELVNRSTGSQTLLRANSTLPTGFNPPLAELNENEFYYCTDDQILLYNYLTNINTVISSSAQSTSFGVGLTYCQDIQIGPSGDLFIQSANCGLIKINPTTGERTLILNTYDSTTPPGLPRYLDSPRDMAVGATATAIHDWNLY